MMAACRARPTLNANQSSLVQTACYADRLVDGMSQCQWIFLQGSVCRQFIVLARRIPDYTLIDVLLENPTKMDDLGVQYPYFWKHSYICFYILICSFVILVAWQHLHFHGGFPASNF